MEVLKNTRGAMGIIHLALIAVAAVLGCGTAFGQTAEDLPRLIEAAKKEGQLSMYSSASTGQCQLVLNRFKEKYPFMKTDYFRSGKVGILTRVLTEQRFKKYAADVMMTSAIQTHILKKNGVLEKYVPPESKFLPPDSRDPEGYWHGIYASETVLGYNKNLVSSKEAPKTYEDLLNPKWKGKIGMEANKVEWFSTLLETKGEGFWGKLSQQKPSLRVGNTLALQLLAAGEFHILANVYLYSVEEGKLMGMPIDWVGLEPVNTYYVAISHLAHAPHPNAAKLFMNFLLTKDGQKALDEWGRTPIRSDVDSKYKKLIEKHKFIVTDIELGEKEKGINDLVGKYFR